MLAVQIGKKNAEAGSVGLQQLLPQASHFTQFLRYFLNQVTALPIKNLLIVTSTAGALNLVRVLIFAWQKVILRSL